jgi:hypothetical protein
MTLPLVLFGVGSAVVVVWGAVLPRFVRLQQKYPRWLASDPAALADFHGKNRRQGIVAGATLMVVGAALLVATLAT